MQIFHHRRAQQTSQVFGGTVIHAVLACKHMRAMQMFHFVLSSSRRLASHWALSASLTQSSFQVHSQGSARRGSGGLCSRASVFRQRCRLAAASRWSRGAAREQPAPLTPLVMDPCRLFDSPTLTPSFLELAKLAKLGQLTSPCKVVAKARSLN